MILLVLTDGRGGCLQRTLDSASLALDGIDRRVLVNDCPDPAYGAWLAETWPEFEIVGPLARKRGFHGAIQAGWDHIGPGPGYVFHLEDDFTFNRWVPLGAMADLLDRHPHLAQVALMRQPWNEEETAAGGIYHLHPDDFDRHDGDQPWMEHSRFFTTNPCLYRRTLIEHGWPQRPHSEGHFTIHLRDEGYRFAYLGHGEEWVTHIGDERTGTGY